MGSLLIFLLKKKAQSQITENGPAPPLRSANSRVMLDKEYILIMSLLSAEQT